ncbi:Curli assembly protein CsgE [Flavobacterium limicola]|uniref:Curli production assembly/transport component CsgE n=1 Tax=Flavobacterium limicola TaxID=180441 RepID=A0A495S6Y8_9FLAO|nr:curli production assembly/transport protein CsgE [Flavobacterium limicola]RKS95637.1 Curli assembly protein CsgE [Flavobacterium limicola]
MKRFLIKIVVLLFYFNIQLLTAQVVYKEVKAKIDIEEIENTLSVAGTVENLKSEFKNISFKLSVFKKNKSNSNKSSNAQDGRVTLEPIQKITLSKTQINKSAEDQIIILLLIYDEDNKIIGKDRVVFGEEDTNLGILKPKDGLEMVGIVSNDTKTKLGNDFYDLFYNAYSKLKLNSSKIISVQEELTFGRTTKISIYVDSEVIEEFIAKPDEDFLKYMAETAAAKVFKYFKNIEKQNKFITQY